MHACAHTRQKKENDERENNKQTNKTTYLYNYIQKQFLFVHPYPAKRVQTVYLHNLWNTTHWYNLTVPTKRELWCFDTYCKHNISNPVYYTLFIHTSLRSWYLTALCLPFDVRLGFVGVACTCEVPMIEVKGESNSSSSSSLVYDFLMTEEPLCLSRDLLPLSPTIFASKLPEGGR